MGTLYIDTGGSVTNSGSTDQNSANLTGLAATVSGSVVTLDGAPDLSGLITSGATQSTIHLNDATNTNKKVFWITAFDNTAKTVTVDTAPTGVVASAWAIGGRHVLTNTSISGTMRAGDTMILNNSPASQGGAASVLIVRATGDTPSGFSVYKGKTGVRPVLNQTSTGLCINSGTNSQVWIENLECDQDGASGNVVSGLNINIIFYNFKISDGGGNGITTGGNGNKLIASELSGIGGDGWSTGDVNSIFLGNYIHDITGKGISFIGTSINGVTAFNIIDTCGGRGWHGSGAIATLQTPQLFFNNTVYGCGDSGFEITDADAALVLLNNIFQDNGNAAGEFNYESAAGTIEAVGVHFYNLFYHQGGGGGANLSGLTVNSTELTSDPLFIDPANGDFRLKNTSPAKAAAFPGQFLGGPLGYLDMGAVQRIGISPHAISMIGM